MNTAPTYTHMRSPSTRRMNCPGWNAGARLARIVRNGAAVLAVPPCTVQTRKMPRDFRFVGARAVLAVRVPIIVPNGMRTPGRQPSRWRYGRCSTKAAEIRT